MIVGIRDDYIFGRVGEEALHPSHITSCEVLHVGKHEHTESMDDMEATQFFNIDDDPSLHKDFEIETGRPYSTLRFVIDDTKFLPIEAEFIAE